MVIKDAGRVVAGGKAPFSFWRSIWLHMLPHRARIYFAAVASTLVGVAVALQPLVLKFIIDDGINRQAPAMVRFRYSLYFICIYLLLSLLRVTVWTIGASRFYTAVEGFLFTLRTTFFRHVQHLCFRFQETTSSGELYNYIFGTPISSIKTFLQQFCMNVPYQVVSWVIIVATLSLMDWMMTLITVAMVVLVVFINHRSWGVIRKYSSDFMEAESTASRYVADMLQGGRAVKIHAVEDRAIDYFESYMNTIFTKGTNLAFRQHLENIKPESIQYVGIAAIYVAGVFLCIYRGLTVGKFFAFVNSINLLMGPMLGFLQLNLIKANAESGLERIEEILHVQSTTPEPSPAARVRILEQAGQAQAGGLPSIEWRDVHFHYDKTFVFNGLSCRIEEGESVALVGHSGSGKTTFISLLLRLYDPQKGEIMLNGTDIRNYPLQELRSAFGVVPQEPFVFQATIRENISMVRPEATDDEVEQALEMAQALEFVRQIPGGLDAEIREGGFNLSGGQRQRLAIARAILAKPLYYIFDEATSALDNKSEEYIREAMEQVMAGHTTIIIAHRLSTIRRVERILVFHDGSIVQDGGYDELARQDGIFSSLLESH